ncbi:MAG: MG2 domain-containing protein [Victivallales bacterium]
MNKKEKNKEAVSGNSSDKPAMDGMLREIARAGEKPDEAFVRKVLRSIREKVPSPVTMADVRDFWGLFFNRTFQKAAAIVLSAAVLSVAALSFNILSAKADPAEIFIYSHRNFSPDQKLSFRVFIRDGQTATAIQNKDLEILLKDCNGKIIGTYKAVTDNNGIAVVEKAFPEIREGDYKIEAYVMNTRQKVNAERQISVRRTYKCMLSTDKPVYQPGQIINIRALTMETSSIKPATGRNVNLEIFDPKGNKVYRKELKTSDFGIAATSFLLADQVNMGDYSIKVSIGNTVSEKTVEVKKYVLPKFSISMKTNQGFYKPGEIISGTVNLSYMFGKPVSGADITVTASDFTDKFNEFSSVKGNSDTEGNYEFSIPLKDYFTGSHLESGDAFVKLDVSAMDSGGHKQASSKKTVISKDTFKIEFFPENGRILPIQTNFYLFACYPDGSPVKAEINIEKIGSVSTDENGIAMFKATPHINDTVPGNADNKPPIFPVFGKRSNVSSGIPCWSLSYTVKSADNREQSGKKSYSIDSLPENFILRTDKAVYKVGDTAKVNIMTSAESGIFFLDVVRNGVCILMKTVEVKNKEAECFIDIDDKLVGTLQIQAYRILPGGEIVSDLRLIQINDPKSLKITTRLDKDKYLPGGNCAAKFAVEDKNGRPVVAALSLSVVDEAVFSLCQMHPGFEKMYFLLQEELLKPRYQIKAVPQIFPDMAGNEKSYQQSAGMLLSNDMKINKAEFTAGESFAKRKQGLDETKSRYEESLISGIIFTLIGIFFLMILPALLLGLKRTLIPAENTYEFIKCDRYEWESSLSSITWKWIACVPMVGYCIVLLCLRLKIVDGFLLYWLFALFIITLLPALISFFGYRKALEKFFRLSWKVDFSHKALLPTFYAYPLYILITALVATVTLCMPVNRHLLEIYFLLILSIGATIYSVYACGVTTFTGGSMFSSPVVRQVPARGLGRRMGESPAVFIFMAFFFYGPIGLILILVPITVISMFMPLICTVNKLGGGDGGWGGYGNSTQEVGKPFIDQDEICVDKTIGTARIRRYFPETLLWIPEIVTDENGKASVEIPLADSITTWRMSTGAVDKNGRLGSSEDKITVFKDFFVDIDFPVKLTQHDIVSIPVTVYNYLNESQTVKLELVDNGSFRISDSLKKEIVILPGQVKSIYFTIEAVKPGKHSLTVKALGKNSADAIERNIEVEPVGERIEKVINGSPGNGKTLDRFEIPGNAVEGSSRAYMRIYPGTFSQIVDGMESILKMPYGCFEQTSSITYPNILALQYMKKTGQISPEIQMKALGMINTGYQRILSFEIPNGGFEWFGRPPANTVLSAYGLMEFCDMQKVYESFDPKVIERTKKWLIYKREADGSWKDERWALGLESNTERTAYILMALAESGLDNSELEPSFNYILRHLDDVKDARTLAYCANAFAAAKRPEADNMIEKLYEVRNEKGDFVLWNGKGKKTIYFEGDNNIYDTETTALVVQAMFRTGHHSTTASKALSWLISKKDKNGNWGTTQSTIQCLRAIIAGKEQKKYDKPYEITIFVNGKPTNKIGITSDNYDVCQLIDLTASVQQGVNSVEVTSPKDENYSYQLVAEYYIPKKEHPANANEILKINVEYEKNNLKVNDIISCRAAVDNNGTMPANMVLVDIGVPPGFDVIPDKLQGMKERNEIEQWEIRGRQVIIYLREIKANSQAVVSFDMKAKYPIRAQTPVSRVYEYYQPSNNSETGSIAIEVEKDGQ